MLCVKSGKSQGRGFMQESVGSQISSGLVMEDSNLLSDVLP